MYSSTVNKFLSKNELLMATYCVGAVVLDDGTVEDGSDCHFIASKILPETFNEEYQHELFYKLYEKMQHVVA